MNSICIYCGSNSGRSLAYVDAAKSLANSLVERKLTLVYGGASVGIMGSIADEVLRLGGDVIGVIPESLVRHELAHQQLTELRVTKTMHERKSIMAELSDGFVAMPGGIGTLEELFEIWTWAQLGFHQKPCGLLNTERYFEPLLQFLDHMVAEQFVTCEHRAMLVAEATPEALLDRFESYDAPQTEKWIASES
ncbi:MAG: TIGR00730 family Rossman fold protein [Planctomycetota bacterium]